MAGLDDRMSRVLDSARETVKTAGTLLGEEQ